MKNICKVFVTLLMLCSSIIIDAQSIHVAPAPLYRDPVTDGVADPVIVWNRTKRCWSMLYTQRRANTEAPNVSYCYGTQIGVAESDDNGQSWTYKGTLNLDFENGHNTFWAPDVVYDSGKYHMFVTYISGVRSNWGGPRQIVHYVSTDLWNWDVVAKLPLSYNSIDPAICQKKDGKWILYFKNSAESHTYVMESDDLSIWSEPRLAIGGAAHEGPKVFFLRVIIGC